MLYIYIEGERELYIYIIYYEGTSRRSCFESVKRVHFPGPQEAMLTACAAAFTAYVRKLFFVHLGRTCTCCRASRPRALDYTIVYGQSAKRDVIWRNPLFTCGFEERNRDARGAYTNRWEGRNPLCTCGLEGRNRGVTTDGRDVIPYLHAGLGGVIGTYEVWGAIVSGSVVSLEFVHMGFYAPCLFSNHMPSQP